MTSTTWLAVDLCALRCQTEDLDGRCPIFESGSGDSV